MRDPFQGLRGKSAQPDTDGWHIEGPWMAAWVLRHLLRDEHEECTVVLALDDGHQLTSASVVARGWGQAARLTTRRVLLEVRAVEAASFILGRARPSTDSRPHPTDIRIAQMVSRAATVHGIPMLDHVVVGTGSTYYSALEERVPDA